MLLLVEAYWKRFGKDGAQHEKLPPIDAFIKKCTFTPLGVSVPVAPTRKRLSRYFSLGRTLSTGMIESDKTVVSWKNLGCHLVPWPSPCVKGVVSILSDAALTYDALV